MLMIGSVEQRCDERSVFRLVSFSCGAQRQNACQLDFKLYVSVLIEVPKEAVLIVFDCGNGRNNQSPRAPDFWSIRQPAICVLPENAEIFLMYADGVRNRERAAAAVAEMRVAIYDAADAVATETKTVGAHPHAVLADIEGVLPRLRGPRISVRHHHLGERSTIKDGALAPAVGVAQMMYRQAFARVEPDHKFPVLPAELIAVEAKARTLRLNDFERLDIGSLMRDAGCRIIAFIWRQGPDAMLFYADHLHGIEIDHRANAFEWPGIAVVGGVGAQETERPRQPAARIFV